MYKKFIIWYLIVALGILPLCPAVRGADTTTDKSVEVRTLSLVPAGEPVPAMSYRLLPRFLDQKTGNAALFYYSAAALCPDSDPGDPEDIQKKISDWRDLPVDQLDRKEVDEALSSFSNCFHQIKLASQRTHCQWEMPLEDGFTMQMPHLATFRRMIFAMQLQIRLTIADRQTDQALEMLQQGLYMGRSIAQGPTVIQDLVGVAITALLLKEVEGLMQMPDSPNLYWALTALPEPMIDMHTSLENEREMLFVEFPQLRNLEKEVLTSAQASAVASNFMKKIQTLGGGTSDVSFKGLLPVGWVMMHYSDAKEFLARKGYSQERIEAMPAAQAVLIYQKQEYLEMLDNMFKWFEIPYSQAQPHLKKGEQRIDDHQRNKGIKANFFLTLLPALSRIAFLQARLDRNIALLRTIEAIRMFAADHSRQLPGSLTEITSVPIPADPVTGKDFIYRRIDARNARLEAPVAPDESKRRPVYELTIKP
ncbi:MAG TPA: hypothetical protein VMW72_08650 [Sedimentisphaerales bacterium]|nr:hypothetical protein [Sedimentisphaerales bacterium]